MSRQNFDKSDFDFSQLEEIMDDFEITNMSVIPNVVDTETEEKEFRLPNIIPILPLIDAVPFPKIMMPISISDSNIRMIEDSKKGNGLIGIVFQHSGEEGKPKADSDLSKIGVFAEIERIIKLPDGRITAIASCRDRFVVTNWIESSPYITAMVDKFVEEQPTANKMEFDIAVDLLKEKAIEFIKETFGHKNIPPILETVQRIKTGEMLVNFIAFNLGITGDEKQELLEKDSLYQRALGTMKFLEKDVQKAYLKNEIQSKVRSEIDRQQRDYFLQQQIKTINEELGDQSENEFEEFEQRAKNKKWSKKVSEHFAKELKKLKKINTNSPDYNIQRNYIELFLDLPWEKYSQDNFDLKRAQEILDAEHFGLEEVKKRIIEYLAILKLRGDMKSPILCLYGPPGVGKTSLGKSVAEALGREYGRISLGGLRDEAEIRGHRKTYIGAMPGRIVQMIKKLGTSNPVIVLDEIDKLGSKYDGDPSSAMLEVLDPEQNNDFYDNFLEMGYDLSKVLFIATANDVGNIHPALRDRMEMINISGYTIEEKVEIAKKHLIKKQLEEHGLTKKDVLLGKREIEYIVEGYTRESGVRGLDKQIAKVIRNIAKKIVMQEEYDPKISKEDLVNILGVARIERDKYENNEVAGVVTGLAWTSVGGEILFIESALSKGKGGLSITGNLGQVMKESATIALEYIKANADNFAIDSRVFEKYNIHIHIPEGATPKDGPSAGIAMLTSLISLLTQKRVKKNIAMTGEITLRGKVLPIGGVKEKILAAKRAGIKELILCKENEKDVLEINQDYLKGLVFHYVTDMDEVVRIAITKEDAKNAKKLVFE